MYNQHEFKLIDAFVTNRALEISLIERVLISVCVLGGTFLTTTVIYQFMTGV